jgi:hypothetical protein
MKIAHFVPILLQTWPPQAILVSDWLISKKSSPLKPLPTKFRFIWQSGFRGDDFLEINQSETRIACGGHVCKMDLDKMCNFNRGSSIDTAYQVSVHLAKGNMATTANSCF